ncbi:MAG: hypothetical protein AB1489_17200 [Acidobacteriota bacterium]
MYRYLIAILFLLSMSPATFAQKDFSLNINPPTQTLNAGRQATYIVSAQPINGFKKPVSLAVNVSPPSADVTISLSSTTISQGSSATITVNTSALANTQNLSISIVGRAKNKVRTTQANLTINAPQFNLLIDPPTATVIQGDVMSFMIRSQGEQDFARDIALNIVATPAIPFQISKLTLSPPADSATLQFVSNNIPVGAYNVTVIATAGQIQRTGSITLTVLPKPTVNMPDLRVILSSVNLRADEVGHLVVTGLAQNVGNGDAIFVKVNIRVFDNANRVIDSGSTFVNGFAGQTSTGLFINTTLPRGKIASFQKIFDVAFVSDSQRVDFAFDFQADTVRAPQADLVVLSLDRTLNPLRGSNFSVRVRNNGKVGARAPQIIIDSFDRANQVFDIVLAGSGADSDILQAGQERTFTASSALPFDQTRVNDAHAIWFDSTSFTVFESLVGLQGRELERKRNELSEMQRMAHNLLLTLR